MDEQITKLCKICNYWLFCIRRRRCLTVTATHQLVQVLLLSRLDYSVKLNDLDLLYFHRGGSYNELWGRVLI